MKQKTCFVIIGYGIKPDYATGREINLDKTYFNIIEPVFKELGFICFRAADIQHSGMIDLPMYENILKADFVVADLTTLNPNVLYELGIRHAVRKNTTLIIAENKLKYPFDLSHIIIDNYEHLEIGIDFDEVNRFRAVLKKKVMELSENPKTDSPIYTIFPNLKTPSFTEEEIEEILKSKEDDNSLSELILQAENAKKRLDFATAIDLLNKAKAITPANDFIIQRLALTTYKSKFPTALDALFKAEDLLSELNPDTSNDIETLGLSGAINKRLFEETGEVDFLDKALQFYERGFYIGQDYYNGINAAFMMTIKSSTDEDKFEAYANFGKANIIRKQVSKICETIMKQKIWDERDDKEWIYLTLAECYLGLNNLEKENGTLLKAKDYFKGEFGLDSYNEQRKKLIAAIQLFNNKHEE